MYLYQEVIPGKKTGKKQSNEQRTSVSKVPRRPSWQTFLHLPSHLRRQHIFLTHVKDSCLDCNCLSHKFTNRGWDGRMASLTWWTWVWAGSGDWWWTGTPGVLQSNGSQRVGPDSATQLNWPKSQIQGHQVDKQQICGYHFSFSIEEPQDLGRLASSPVFKYVFLPPPSGPSLPQTISSTRIPV